MRLCMCISVVCNTKVLKHFVEECVGSIILGVMEIFVSIRQFWLKKIQRNTLLKTIKCV